MSAGIYMNNGVLAYSMDLEKKLKRRKNAIIIEEYIGDKTGLELEKELQILLNKHLQITKPERIETEVLPLKYTFTNGKEIIISIYPDLHNIPNINKNEWWLVK